MKIIKEGKEIEIETKAPKGKHTKQGFKLFTEIMDESKLNPESLNNYMDFLDNITSELTGMTVEELDELESDEKNKLVSFYQQKIVEKVDFLKSSLKSENSEPQTAQK